MRLESVQVADDRPVDGGAEHEAQKDGSSDDQRKGALQRLEIARALARGARVLILDEPTAVLAPVEVGELLRLLGELRERGMSVVLISHKLEEITATELNARRLRGDALQIIDVREPHEFEIARIPGTKLIPLGHVVARMNEINQDVETIVHCKGGVRSAKAIAALKHAGFTGKLINLKGGISAWSDDVDPNVAKY